MTVFSHGALERWIAWIRLGAVAWALLQLTIVPMEVPYPDGYELAAWIVTGVLAAGALPLLLLSSRDPLPRWLGPFALVFDAAVVAAYILIFSFEPGTPIRQLGFIPVIEAALRYGLAGGILMPFVLSPVAAAFEWMRDDRREYDVGNVTFTVGVQLIGGLFVGWLVRRLASQTLVAEQRAQEAERLRDELGRRVDVLDATGRVARALASSLELEEAFSAFIRELRGLVPFDRMAIVLEDGESMRVMAAAGEAADAVMPTGARIPPTPLASDIVRTGQTLYRPDIAADPLEEEREFRELGLRSRVAAPLVIGTRTTGFLGLLRREPHAFSEEEIELLSVLGRLVATAVQNIRSYEAERSTVDELRRLSALRADFVSLVSHELRSPMAAVIGSARTLQQRWRSLSPEQRESFLALIADETTRLANLIADVLDTSRIEAGTFSFSFSDVDVAAVLRDTVAAAELAQDEVRLALDAPEGLPAVRGDRERIRQVLANLIDNAVKYTPAGGEVSVVASRENGGVRVDVTDQGPGIAPENHKLIFEKFGRVRSGDNTKPGTGLGLFIARSITEAHGGRLEVHSAPRQGATFTLTLPAPP